MFLSKSKSYWDNVNKFIFPWPDIKDTNDIKTAVTKHQNKNRIVCNLIGKYCIISNIFYKTSKSKQKYFGINIRKEWTTLVIITSYNYNHINRSKLYFRFYLRMNKLM